MTWVHRRTHVGRSAGDWNKRFGAVHRLDVSALHTAGRYRVSRPTPGAADLLRRQRAALFSDKAVNATKFFQVQRDGADVIPRALNRKPSHLADRKATVYEQPVFAGEGGDGWPAAEARRRRRRGRRGRLVRRGRLRQVHARHRVLRSPAAVRAALPVARQRPGARDRARPRAGSTRCGTPSTGVLYAQVGIGTGSEEFGFLGDHDVWRLPEADDALDDRPGRLRLLPQAPPGVPGRHARRAGQPQPGRRGSSAAFALAAQSARAGRPRAGPALARRGRRLVRAGGRPRTSASWSPRSRTPTTPRTPGRTTWSSAPPSLPSPAKALGDPRAAAGCATPRTGRGLPRQRQPGHAEPLRHQRPGPHRPDPAAPHGLAAGDQAPSATCRRQLDVGVEARGGQPIRPRRRREPSSTPRPAASASRRPPACTGR